MVLVALVEMLVVAVHGIVHGGGVMVVEVRGSGCRLCDGGCGVLVS